MDSGSSQREITWGHRFDDEQIVLLQENKTDELMERHYHSDAVLVTFQGAVRGEEALKQHFRKYMKKLGQLTVPVYLLHGSGDTLIPSSETLWLAQDIPAEEIKAVLISPALIHVDMDKTVSRSEQWAIISFMAQVLNAADQLPDTAAAKL